jgi:diacylglycerol O-acyltransferase
MRKLSALDLAFFLAESQDSPKHVAGLMLCKKPPGSAARFGRTLVEELKTHQDLTEPFNLLIQFSGLKGPHWKPCDNFDINDHVFYHGQRKRISWLDAKDFAARLHEPVMDRTRPLWEYHLIDGIEGNRFAVYTKIHHAYADGVTMANWLDKSMATSPGDMRLRPPWTMPSRHKSSGPANGSVLTSTIKGLNRMARGQLMATGGIAKLAVQQSLERLGITNDAVTLSFNASERSPLTGSSSPGRTIATSWISMADVRKLCKATRATLNHVALSCIDGALHRYLTETGNTIDHPITIQMPVNLRSGTRNKEAGNKLGVALVELANPTDDPYQRLSEIGHSLHRVKKHINSVSGNAMEQFTVLTALTGEVIEKLKLSNRLPANGHVLVSNLPGPPEPRYLKGARLEQMYPVSVLVPGLRMNITLFSCGGILNFGIVATKDLGNLDRLAQLIREEFELLKNAITE